MAQESHLRAPSNVSVASAIVMPSIELVTCKTK